MNQHPHSEGWALPPAERQSLPKPFLRCNLRELAARPGRFEHHLTVVARVGQVQLELATASEPLYFAHRNCSDEYVLPLPTGISMVDAFPLRVFLAEDDPEHVVGRINHHVGELVLHPYGFLHWPGQLRPPYQMPPIPPEMHRCALSLVLCAGSETAPAAERRTWVSPGLADRAKQKAPTGQALPFHLVRLSDAAEGPVAWVDDVVWTWLSSPAEVTAERGGYVLVWSSQGETFWDMDLVYLPPGLCLATPGVSAALLLASSRSPAEPPPPSWTQVPRSPMAPFAEADRLALPQRLGALEISEHSPEEVRVTDGEVSCLSPRRWLARTLFRLPLHGYRLGYVETYGGLFFDDRSGTLEMGIRRGSRARFAEPALPDVQRLYRAVAPPGYRESPG